ncbi:MAG: trypsin-like peptidase domain-containing protein [Micropepsaceae bacterium]
MRKFFVGVVLVLAVVAGAWFFRNDLANQAWQLNPSLGRALSADQPGNFAAIINRVSPAVVTIETKARNPKESSIGSGFVIDAEGHIVTNDHVIDKAERITVYFEDGTRANAVLVGTDKPTDIALLKVTVERPLVHVRFGDEHNSEVGDWVLAIGSPDYKPGTVTAGILSAKRRDGVDGGSQFTDYLQIDAALNHGNSGGPTFNMAGEVIGVNVLASYNAVDPTTGVGERNEGLAFAIPASTVSVVVKGLRSGRFNRGLLGVILAKLSDDDVLALGLKDRKGALVTSAVAGSPAEKAGLRTNDVILKVDDLVVESDLDCLRKISLLQPGQIAAFTIWRNKAELEFSITVGSRDALVLSQQEPAPTAPASIEFAAIGATLRSSPLQHIPSRTGTGVFVETVSARPGVAGAGIRSGDRITGIGSLPVNSLADIDTALKAAQANKDEAVIVYLETPMGGSTHASVRLKSGQ